ncbi:DUF2785 domain-containing protein [Fictibacillus sp. UD]|uniref:DUF2785 domain-containing protein n=1 Tax=Fictibacillus sp. UD TaxID=3038777 RepID=UPI0037477742
MTTLLSSKVQYTETELFKILNDMKSGQKKWGEENKKAIVDAMITHIGSPTSDLRELVYRSFCESIIENQLDPALLKELMDYSLNNLLHKGIGDNGTDSVFTRAFTTLLIDVIIYKDNEADFLPQETVTKAKDAVIQYIHLEEDLRGYVPVKGWAHSVAHVADTSGELLKSEKVSQKDYFKIIEPLLKKYCNAQTVFVHGEDDRVVMPVLAMLNKGVGGEELEAFVAEIPANLKAQKEELPPEVYWYVMANCKSLLKSLYLGVSGDEKYVSLAEAIRNSLSEM